MVVVLFILILLLITLSLKSVEYFVLSNLILAAILPTIDRFVGGLPFSFGIIKIPFLIIGFGFHLFMSSKLEFNRKLLNIIGLFLLFLSIILVASHNYKGVSIYDAINLSGLLLFPITFLIAILPFKFEKFFIYSINYFFIWAVFLGLLQYIIGPDGFSSLGFHLETPNTENTYSRTFTLKTVSDSIGIRPFSFFTSSACFAAMMFYACIGSVILWPDDKKLLFPKKVTIPILFLGLFIAQFKTFILIVALCLFIYFYKYKKVTLLSKRNLLYLSIAIIGIFSLALFFSDVWFQITEHFGLKRSDGGPTTIASRLVYIAKYPFLIKGHFLWGYGYFMDPLVFSSDSKWLYFILFTGLPAALAYISITIYFMSVGKKIIKNNPQNSYEWKVGILCYLTFLSVLFNNLSNGHLEASAPSNIFLWIIAGYSLKKFFNN